jgi:hypothetical protein
MDGHASLDGRNAVQVWSDWQKRADSERTAYYACTNVAMGTSADLEDFSENGAYRNVNASSRSR